MDPVSSAISMVDICIRYGTALVQVCKSYHRADQEIRETILKIEAHWLKIQYQLGFLRNVWSSLDEDYQIHQNTVLQVLLGKVTAATTLVDRVVGSPSEEASVKTIKLKGGEARRTRYALWAKSSLEAALADLKDWSEIFGLSWSLISLQPGSTIDHELRPVDASHDPALLGLKDLRDAIQSTSGLHTDAEKSSVFLSPELLMSDSTSLRYSSIEVRLATDGVSRHIIDVPSETTLLANVCNLAKRLKNIGLTQVGILRCHGVLKQDAENNGTPATRFVFALPDQFTAPHTLRELQIIGMENHPLNERFMIAKQLAKAIMFVHSAGFVHKNIRPETILVCRDELEEPCAVLVGFKDFRLDEGRTLLHGDDLWEANLYRHPTRQGVQPEESYVMQHDIYSLGACLLEIGIGSSFVQFDSDDSLSASSLLSGVLDFSIKDTRRRAFQAKRGLIEMAKEILPAKMGRKYTDIVLTCLTCLDSDNAFGSEADLLDENGLLVGVRFIEKILIALLNLTI